MPNETSTSANYLPSALAILLVTTVAACSNNDGEQVTEVAKPEITQPETTKPETAQIKTGQTTTGALGSYNVNLKQTSVSGLSSGAFMTSQLYMVHSDIMIGAGVVAGGPYLCSRSWPMTAPMITATTTCMNPPDGLGPNLPRLETLTQELSGTGDIDAITNLANDRIYLFSGQNDHTVYPPVVDSTLTFFTDLGVPVDAINYDNSVNAGHSIITNHADDVPCAETASPYINNCDFMQSTRIIEHIYPDAQPPVTQATGQLIEFDQTEFLPNNITSMSEKGYAYVPEVCVSGTECRLHVALHGCEQGYESIGDQYYTTTGYNEMADANQLIVLYPQASKSITMPVNPKGCWDFWGYSSYNQLAPDFYTREAPQIKAIYGMIERLSGASAEQ